MKRWRAKERCSNSWNSTSRPTRSWSSTCRYFSITRARLVALGGAKRSLMTLKTNSYDGRVNTVITMPRWPTAASKRSSETAMWPIRSRYSSVLPCLV